VTDKPDQRAATTQPAMTMAMAHFRFGWWSLLVFVCLGLVLEGLHGFKIRGYLDVSNETRRLLWTLAHAHGALIALVHIGFGATLRLLPKPPATPPRLASRCLMGATLLMPAGFFLGGAFIYDGDPGLGALLVPPGGLLLATAVFATARTLRGSAGP
jgi:hypothetical protein